jgi:hypothetical protein
MKGLEALNELSDKDKRNKYKLVDERYIPRSKFKDSTANELTGSIIRWLELNNFWATRVNTTGRYLIHQKKWIPGTTKKGTADAHAVIAGRHVSIEVKIGRDKMSEDQKEVKQQIEASGGVYITVGTFEDFYTWYNDFITKTNDDGKSNN